jgi:hypothetical protein
VFFANPTILKKHSQDDLCNLMIDLQKTLMLEVTKHKKLDFVNENMTSL